MRNLASKQLSRYSVLDAFCLSLPLHDTSYAAHELVTPLVLSLSLNENASGATQLYSTPHPLHAAIRLNCTALRILG